MSKYEKVTIRTLLDMFAELDAVKYLKGPKDEPGKFGYAVHRNMEKIQTAITDARMRFPSMSKQKSKEYDGKRVEILEKFCLKSEEGEPVIENGCYSGLDANEEFNAAMTALDAEYADLLAALDGYMKAECEMSFYKILPDFIPGGLCAVDIEKFAFIVTEEMAPKRILT